MAPQHEVEDWREEYDGPSEDDQELYGNGSDEEEEDDTDMMENTLSGRPKSPLLRCICFRSTYSRIR